MKKITKKINIFILDDDRYYGMFLKNALEDKKFSIQYFQNEKDCIENLKVIPEILILDHKLENTTGLEILDALHKQNNGETLVIYLSAQEHVHIAIKALKEGAVTYIEKSGDAVEVIKDHISHLISFTKNFNEKIDLNAFRNSTLT